MFFGKKKKVKKESLRIDLNHPVLKMNYELVMINALASYLDVNPAVVMSEYLKIKEKNEKGEVEAVLTKLFR